VHTADIHFGVENYGRIDTKTGIHTRLLDFERAFAQCIDYAIEQDVDFFLFAGDAYKTPYPTPTQQKLLLNQIFRLQEKKIPVVIVVGNHDHPLSFGRAHALDVFNAIRHDGFHVFSRPEARTIATKNGPVQVVGVPWPMRNNVVTKEMYRIKSGQEVTDYLSRQVVFIIKELARQLDPSLPAVLAGHLTVANGVFSGSEKRAVYGTDPLFLPSQLAIPPFDYVALGHLHRHQNLNTVGGIPVVYAGSPERVDFGERKEDKGFCFVTITIEGFVAKKTTYEFCPLAVRPMKQVDITLNAQEDQTEQVVTAIQKHSLKDAIVKVVYHVPIGHKDSVDMGRVQRACKDAYYVASIVPVHEVAPRTHRVQLRTEMTAKQLLERYFSMQELEKKRKERLLKKALCLVEEYEYKQEHGDEALHESS